MGRFFWHLRVIKLSILIAFFTYSRTISRFYRRNRRTRSVCSEVFCERFKNDPNKYDSTKKFCSVFGRHRREPYGDFFFLHNYFRAAKRLRKTIDPQQPRYRYRKRFVRRPISVFCRCVTGRIISSEHTLV